MKYYDVIVVGAGHAGCEAALAAARVGAETLLVTLHLDHIAQMSCNPAIGGIAKGQVVREIDALGGAQGIVAEAAAIQFRQLNRTKGPAVWSPRAQCDKAVYSRAMKFLLENTEHLHLLHAEVTGFLMENGHPSGIITHLDEEISCKAIVLTTGTFLHGLLHYGMKHLPGGRSGDFPSDRLSDAIAEQLGLKIRRLKTGTPPRILARSIDFSVLAEQPSEPEPEEFSFWSPALRPELPVAARRHLSCHMLHTTAETAEIVKENLHLSPMYQGVIKGIGTRYCPSFEDKVVRFPHHEQHLLFLEPEGALNGEYYVNGFSTSLPIEVQEKLVRSLPGLKNAEITRYAYAIEYDSVLPEQMERSFRNKKHPNLFTAGQINGTSGYEEAAGQGLIAGLNAARCAAGLEPVVLGREQAYIGVMADDLACKEITEPYRLFTSRAESRLTLRQENADLRLCEFAHANGILPEPKYREFTAYKDALNQALDWCRTKRLSGKPLLIHLREMGINARQDAQTSLPPELQIPLPEGRLSDRVWRELLVEAHYDGYLQRERLEINRLAKLEAQTIPDDFDYGTISGLSNESRQKLERVRPQTLGQAERIDGVTPTDVALIQVFIRKRKAKKK